MTTRVNPTHRKARTSVDPTKKDRSTKSDDDLKRQSLPTFNELQQLPQPGVTAIGGIDPTRPPNNLLIISDTIKVLKAISAQLKETLSENSKKANITFQELKIGEIDTFDLQKTSEAFEKWMQDNQKALKHLKTLDLSNLGLTSLPKSLNLLSSLEFLDLKNNKFETFSANLVGLDNLKHLDLSNNQIKKLPSWIGYFQNLEILTLSNNNLSSIDKNILSLKNLTQIELDGNNFEQIPEVLCLMKKEEGTDKKLDVCIMVENQGSPWPIKISEKKDLSVKSIEKRKIIKKTTFCSPVFQNFVLGIIITAGLAALSITWINHLDNVSLMD